MCNSIQSARNRRDVTESFASLLTTADKHRQETTERQICAYEHGNTISENDAKQQQLQYEINSSADYRRWGMDTQVNHGEASNSQYSPGRLADLLDYEPFQKVSPDGSLSPTFAANAGLTHPSASYDSADSPSGKKKHHYQQQHRRVLEAEMTAKGHQRQYAKHNYHDHANDEVTSTLEPNSSPPISLLLTPMRGGVIAPFPLRLHTMLDAVETEHMTDIVCWQPHGRAFVVHDPKRFVRQIMPRFFRQHKYSSFQRQLNLYGFMRLTRKGPDHGGYYHELFLRDRLHLCASMQRVRVKGTLVRTSSSPQTEPDFYTMAFVERLQMSTSNGGEMTMQVEEVPRNNDDRTWPRYDDLPAIKPLHRPYLVHSSEALANPFGGMNTVLDERGGATLSRRLGMHRTPSEEADLARFLEGVDLYASDVETTAAV